MIGSFDAKELVSRIERDSVPHDSSHEVVERSIIDSRDAPPVLSLRFAAKSGTFILSRKSRHVLLLQRSLKIKVIHEEIPRPHERF